MTQASAVQRFNGKCTTEQLVRNWGISYIGNQIGILGVIALLGGAGIFSYSTPGILSTAITKVNLTFQQVCSGLLRLAQLNCLNSFVYTPSLLACLFIRLHVMLV